MKTDVQYALEFRAVVWEYYAKSKRDMPWRSSALQLPNGTLNPYAIMVSELMLQQTQVSRVIPKYQEFMTLFPTVHALAQADQGDVLRAWSGLGYNRRARFLWLAAQEIVARFGGEMPKGEKELCSLPGIGKNTAGAIRAYAFNLPSVFIETNIRTVYLHHFFKDHAEIPDAAIVPLVVSDVEANSGKTREWYWALMDYGAHLKSTVGNVSRASKHYVRQSAFQGSLRQVRGAVLKELGRESLSADELRAKIADDRIDAVLEGLLAERLIRRNDDHYML